MHQARDRLLEGFLLRLAAARDPDAYTLRGGMLVHAWVPGAGRAVRDLDLICALPRRELRARIREVLAAGAGDGVTFDADRFRLDTIRGKPPMLSLFARGEVDGAVATIAVDFVLGIEIWPRAERRAIALARGEARLWTCPHEMVIGTKLGLLDELGPRAWRSKDLADLWLLARRFFPTATLGEVLEQRRLDPQRLLAMPWWHDDDAAARWSRCVARQPALPLDLDGVVTELRRRLAPFARQA